MLKVINTLTPIIIHLEVTLLPPSSPNPRLLAAFAIWIFDLSPPCTRKGCNGEDNLQLKTTND